MSTVSEIEEAICRLSLPDRQALEDRLLIRRFGLDALEQDERAELLASLDEAEAEIDRGDFVTGDQIRESITKWAGR